MSTDLYGIRILEVDPAARRVQMRVFVVYYDTYYKQHQPIPSDRSFFVRVLCDVDALGHDISEDDRFSESYIDQNAFRFVDRFTELSTKNSPFEFQDDGSDFYYEREGGWQDEDKLLQADFDVFVTDSKYLDPFTVGQSWGTTSYETMADGLLISDYPHVPDFGDSHTFVPFPDLKEEETTVAHLSFSADGNYLIAGNNEGGFGVFDTKDWSTKLLVPNHDTWLFGAGWTKDGRIGGTLSDGVHVAYDLETGAHGSFTRFGPCASPTGERFLNGIETDVMQVIDDRGEVLFETPRGFETCAYAAFDATQNVCGFAIEGQDGIRLVDLQSKEERALTKSRVNSVSMSPDARYVLATTYNLATVIRVLDDTPVRWMRVGSNMLTASAWSPDGKLTATSKTDPHGYHSTISIHRIGAEIEAADLAPSVIPESSGQDIADVVKLYINQVANFAGGWKSHLDDDYLDFHIMLKNMGSEFDLVPKIDGYAAQIAARAYESQVTSLAGDGQRAEKALKDALARLEAEEIQDWAYTFVYAPIAAAQYLCGQEDAAKASIKLAQKDLANESNPFQKRAILCRAYLAMGDLDALLKIALEKDDSWVTTYQIRLLINLIDAGELKTFEELAEHWAVADDWSAKSEIERVLKQNRIQDYPEYKTDTSSSPRTTSVENLDPPDHAEALANQDDWEGVYSLIDSVRKTMRNELYQRVLGVTAKKHNYAVTIDMLKRLPCTDFNSPGLRGLQAAIKTIAGKHYRELHP